MKEQYMRFGEYIRKKRQDDPRELTQREVSQELGISLPYYSDIEHGRKKPFDATLIEKFCVYLDLTEAEKASYVRKPSLPKDTRTSEERFQSLFNPYGGVPGQRTPNEIV